MSQTALGAVGIAFTCGLMAMGLGCTKPVPTKAQRASTVTVPEAWLTGGTLIFSDDFERDRFGEDWGTTSDSWRIDGGEVRVSGARNEGLWWQGSLPTNVRVEFDARATSKEGDLKFEAFGTERGHESGYIFVLGGWKNSLSIIARKDEHGDDRLESRQRLAEPNRTYRFGAIRAGGAVHWLIDGELFLTFADGALITGEAFGFNDWDAPLAFDNVKIYSLD